jgi:hypothetical protein
MLGLSPRPGVRYWLRVFPDDRSAVAVSFDEDGRPRMQAPAVEPRGLAGAARRALNSAPRGAGVLVVNGGQRTCPGKTIGVAATIFMDL